MLRSRSLFAMVCLVIVCATCAQAQSEGKSDSGKGEKGNISIGETSSSAIMHLIRYDGTIDSKAGLVLPNVAGITFALYDDRDAGTALWIETQNVLVDEQGHYSALLGSTKTEGVPEGLFATGQARWLGVQVSGQLTESRTPLGSVPYAVQAGDAETLGGRSASEFVLAEQMHEQVRSELRSAGVDIPETGSSGGEYRTQVKPSDVPPPSVQEMVSEILRILQQPDPVFSFSLCTEPAGQFEVAGKSNLVLNGSVVGKVGADVYGNGGVLLLRAKPEGGVDTGFKFGWDFLKLGVCADLRAAIQRLRALNAIHGGAQLQRAALDGDNHPAVAAGLLDHVANLNEDALLEKMVNAANGLQFDPAKLQDLLDRIQNLSFDGGPLAILQDNDDRAALMDALPMPPGVRTVLSKPADLIAKLKDLLDSGICNLSDNAPALDPLLEPVCQLAENEKYAKLLDRVDTVTGTINTTVNTVNTRVQNVLNKLPTDSDCKLFCHRFLFFGE